MKQMKNNVHGFSLLSFVLYSAVFSVLISLTCAITGSLIIPSILSIRYYQTCISLHIAIDSFVHDVRELSSNKYILKYGDSHSLVWHDENNAHNKNIGWHIFDNALERIEGVYANGWKTKKSYRVFCGVEKGSFIMDERQGITLILVPSIDKTYKVETYVSIIQ